MKVSMADDMLNGALVAPGDLGCSELCAASQAFIAAMYVLPTNVSVVATYALVA